jgi:hypothetical protein
MLVFVAAWPPVTVCRYYAYQRAVPRNTRFPVLLVKPIGNSFAGVSIDILGGLAKLRFAWDLQLTGISYDLAL